MDKTKVEQIAREHRDIAARRDDREYPDTATARLEEAQALEQLWHEIEQQCADFCAAYNHAFGALRIRSELHGDTVVVRSLPDQQDTLVFSRILSPGTHRAGIEAHRYHYPAHPVDLPVGLRPTVGRALTLTYRDQHVTPEDLVLELLSTFTDELARAQRRETPTARAAEHDSGLS
jgi:hypothetical protein